MKFIRKKLFPIVSLILVLLMTFGMAACGKNKPVNTGDNDIQQPGTEQPGTENPDTEQPGTEQPGTEQPGEDGPTVDNASIVEKGAYNESMYVVWEGSATGTKVEYRLSNESKWSEVDSELIRKVDDNEARVDILGLKAGTYYVKITPTSGEAVETSSIEVSSYDRSGYAHFNYSEGVGAYNDDGTLKDGALVIYVTEFNKNSVIDSAYVDGKKVDIKPYMNAKSAAEGVGTGLQTGIGELLNNRRYSGSDRMNVGIAALCNAYGSVAIRIIGKVSAEVSDSMESSIVGLTTYNSTGNGGSKGDNGRMARMVNAHDLTIEGVGDDASIFGWGVHFIASDVLGNYPRAGKGFEVRNITFENYPEDAVGMEGIQGDKWDANGSITGGASSVTADLPSPVERCWIHNNTFLPGYASNPAESDKAEGDGSCDFKRGYNYTLAYNYFTDCHKTNLIGSSDKSLQFNITMHHNWWNNCGSRMPLVRNANVHFYNNYFSGDMSATPKPSLSYVTSARANSYMFSENNYFEGAKQVVLLASGGQVKSYGDMFYATFGTYSGTIVSSRDQTISNNCQFQKKGWDLSKFDTNSEQFYYKDGKSDCLLDDAVAARQNAMMHAGANGHGVTDTAMNKYTPSTPVVVNKDGSTISLPTAKSDTEVNGVMFRNISGVASGTIKFKEQGITFTLAAEAQLTVTTTTTGDSAPELLDSEGRVYAHKFEGTLTIVLQPGTYIIASGQKEKEAVISLLKFDDTTASSAARVQAAVDAINALAAAGDATLSDEYEALLNRARSAYNALTATEKEEFDSAVYANLKKAIDDFGTLRIAEFERLVDAIGTVNENSYNAIYAAQQAYDKLSSELQVKASSAKATLDAAWAAYEQFAVLNVENLIKGFAERVNASDINESTARATIESLLDESENIILAYEALSDDTEDGPSQQSQVKNYSDLTAAIAKLENIYKLYVFDDALAYFEKGHTVTSSDAGKVSELKAAYEALSSTQKALVSDEDKALYDDVLEQFETIMRQTITSDFSNDGKPSDTTGTFTTAGNKKSQALKVLGITYAKGLKVDGNGVLTIKADFNCTVTLYVLNSNTFKLDGEDMTVSPTAATEADTEGYTLTFTLEAGTHKITRGSSENSIYFAVLSPV